jgi:TatD DNase family protein
VVDTHAHLGLCKPDDAELVSAAAGAGVRRILTVGLGEDSNPDAIEAARTHAGVFAAVGSHPNSAGGFDDRAAEALAELAGDPHVVAVGETGLDFYRSTAPRDDQRRALAAQIEIARRVVKPLVIHVRDGADPGDDAVAQVFATLASEAEDVSVILHCFSAPPERVAEAAEHGWWCSFAGNVTYPKAGALREAARLVPDELLLVETDSPFLAPQPVRGKANQPENVVATAQVLADVRGIDYASLEDLVEANAEHVFGW